MRGKANLKTWLMFAVFLLLTVYMAVMAEDIYADVDANDTDTFEAITVFANPLKDTFAIGQQVPLEIVITNHSQEHIYIRVDENGYLMTNATMEDANGITYPYMIPLPPAPPRDWWIEVDGKKTFVVPVIKIEPNQTITAVIHDALELYNNHDKNQLPAGTYYLRPGNLYVIHEAGFIITRDNLNVKLWIDPNTIETESYHQINKVEITLVQKIIYVDEDATGVNDGSSWENAYTYLQDALADAETAEKPIEIRVAQGIYTPDQGVNQTLGDQEVSFQLINGVALKGGYAGFTETEPNHRDIKAFETILSGDLDNNDVDVNDIHDMIRTMDWNSRTIVTSSSIDSSAVLNGFTIIGGKGSKMLIPMINPDANHPYMGRGAGMHNSTGSPTIINCIFTCNYSWFGAGGMLNTDDSNPTVVNCTFTKNYTDGKGGGMTNRTNSNPTLIDCMFSDNFARRGGGAIYNEDSNSTLTECAFSNNTAYFSEGGAIFNIRSSFISEACIFKDNTASFGGSIYNDENSSLNLTQCIFNGNTAEGWVGKEWIGNGRGGAIASAGNLILNQCVFNDNSTEHMGGAITSSSGSIINNCIFMGNSAIKTGGAVYVRSSSLNNCVFAGNRALGIDRSDINWEPSAGGAVTVVSNKETLSFTNCTFYQNWADLGNAINNKVDIALNLANCILWGSGNQIYDDPSSKPTFACYSNIQSGWPGEGNINVDPLFADPGYWADANDPNNIAEPNDPNAVWINGDYHLKSQAGRWDPVSESWVIDDVTSPCIDAGDPNSPVGDEPEPNGSRINMGAYGGTKEASKSYAEE